MKKKDDYNDSPAQAVFEGYKGKILYRVSHPKYKPIIVSAPAEEAAIKAAADYYGISWTSYEFYAWCNTQRIF